VPEWTEEHSFGQVFSFSGVNYVISDNDRMPKEQEVFSMLKADRPLFLYSLDRSSASITGVQYHPGDQTGTPAERSAEAAAAAALVLHKELQNGTMESTIDQPGGILEIGLRKENGKLLGLSAGGPVEVRK
ncbi:MAG: hypothetical protein II685_06365, partial [Clostridia bacterium]|nr:hypothetical protein [Clostridia bacterium]